MTVAERRVSLQDLSIPMYKESTGTDLWDRHAIATAPPRVVAIFADRPESALRAIRHSQNGAPTTPIWLFTTKAPPPAVAGLCHRVIVHAKPIDLLTAAERELWPRRAALVIGDWSGPASTLLKLAPFFLPPFRTLFLNHSGDFLPGTPGPLAIHWGHRLREGVHNSRVRAGEIAGDTWALLRHHVWRSGPVNRVRDRARAASLFLAGSVLRTARYPHRRLFAKLHGSEPLHFDPLPDTPASREIICFYQRDHHWDPAALRRAAESGNARFLVWHNGAGPGPVEDLLPLFDDPATFAVSRQSSFRAWKPTLFPTAPFRTLQPGEFTRVLAPLGSSIVLDIHKLAALGIPRTSHPITAWLILFWKAAAAGWRSYSAGQDCPLSTQSDFPSEEAAFLARLAVDPAFRALGPRQPLLDRGNVAFSTQRPARLDARPGHPRVLIVSPFLPFPLSHGGAVRIYNLCRALSGRVDFALIAVREQHETVDYAKLHELFAEVRIVDLDQTAPASRELPQQVRQHECPALRAAISELCGEWRPDLIQFEYTHTAALKDAAPGIPALLVEHDITHSLYRQLAEADPSRKARREYQRWLAFETRALAGFEGVWTVSESDRSVAIASGARAPERTFAIANGVDTERFRPTPESTGAPEILYVGSFRHLPNILAFERLRMEIMPLVWQRFPDARLRVVAGPRHEYFWQRFHRESHGRAADRRIAIHDFVEDLRPLYAAATVVAVPLAVSAGTNIKVMEAMACGRAIVSTTAGCAGLGLADSGELLIRDSSAAFAEGLGDLLGDAELRGRIAGRARQTAEARFSWPAIAEDALRSYQSLLG